MYRDSLAGLKSQVATKRGLFESRERAMSALLRAMLPLPLQEAMRSRRESVIEPDTLEDWTRVDMALDEMLAAQEEAGKLIPALRECAEAVPDPPKGRLAPPWAIEEPIQLEFRSRLTERVVTLDADGYVVRWDDPMYLARLRVRGSPITITSRLSANPLSFRSTARTSVPATTPNLRVRRDRLLDAVGRTVGLVRDWKTGHDRFDEQFIVSGDEVATCLLTNVVIEALKELHPLRPELEVRRGIAELRWGVAYARRAEPLLPTSSIAALIGIRSAIEHA